jgi:hypothetical protein
MHNARDSIASPNRSRARSSVRAMPAGYRDNRNRRMDSFVIEVTFGNKPADIDTFILNVQ